MNNNQRGGTAHDAQSRTHAIRTGYEVTGSDPRASAVHLMGRKEAARYIGVAYSTLKTWASTHKERIPHFKVGRKVLYSQSDLDEWLWRHRHE